MTFLNLSSRSSLDFPLGVFFAKISLLAQMYMYIFKYIHKAIINDATAAAINIIENGQELFRIRSAELKYIYRAVLSVLHTVSAGASRFLHCCVVMS